MSATAVLSEDRLSTKQLVQLNLSQIKTYYGNPRKIQNPHYEGIKEAILTITLLNHLNRGDI